MSYFAYQWGLRGPCPVKFDEIPCDGNGIQKPFEYIVKIPPGYRGLDMHQLSKLYPAPIKK